MTHFPNDLKILYEDNHLLAVHKPAGLLTQSDSPGSSNLLDLTREWVKQTYVKKGNVYLGLVHRLDRNVSGVVLFAKTSKAAARLADQFRNKTARKFYRAHVEGIPEIPENHLVHYLRKEKSLRATVFPRPTPKSQKAELSYKVVEELENSAVLEIELHTGRFHQIRAQLAFIGHPIVGDTKYRSQVELPEQRISLHAHTLIVQHPTTKEEIKIESPPPDWSALG